MIKITKQLLKVCYSYFYNHSGNSFCEKHHLLFNMSSDATAQDQAKENLTEWIRTNRVTTQEINCDDFIFTKIIQGDKSDNIRSVVTWTKTAASGKIMNYSITEKNANKILDKFKETEGDFTIDKFFNKDCVNLIVDIFNL